MKKYQASASIFIVSFILFTGFNSGIEKNIDKEAPSIRGKADILKGQVKVSIANAKVIKSDQGQKPVRVMVYLSEATAGPVTVKYATEDRSAKAGVDYIATEGSVRFEQGELAKWVTVPIIGEVSADTDESAPVTSTLDFIIKVTESIGVIRDAAIGYITIIQDISRDPSIAGVGPGGNRAVYEVKISYRGYTSFSGGNTDECGIRRDGTVELSGLLAGIENTGPGEFDDIDYTGNLEMTIDMDICSVHRLPNGEDELCGMRVNGSGTVFTELKIYYDSKDEQGTFDSRGAYIKIENKDGQFRRVVTGDCNDQIDDEWGMVPNKSIASIFNGNLLSIINTRTLRKGDYEGFDEEGNHTVVQVLRKLR